jgi:hypothetical protein
MLIAEIVFATWLTLNLLVALALVAMTYWPGR